MREITDRPLVADGRHFCEAEVVRDDRSSDTAVLIARSMLLSARDPELGRLLAPGEESLLERSLAEKASAGWFGFARRTGWCRRFLKAAEGALLGGISAHYLARKRWIEIEVRAALERGAERVVVLGAGLDTLASRLCREYPDVGFVEVDHPATQSAKRRAGAEGGNLRLLSADLSRTGLSGLLEAGPPTVVIAEGLTMYLDEPRVSRLLESAAGIAGRRGSVVFTFMEMAEDGSIGFRGEHPAVGWWLRMRREPFLWGCRRRDLAGFVEKCGLRVEKVADDAALAVSVLRPAGLDHAVLARGESLCLCSPSP